MCSNCYNGCTEVTSDKCVRYTGVDVPVLEIQTGDSLSYVEQALITFLTSTLDGTGIKPTIPSEIICTLVSQYLPTCEDLTVVNLLKALIQAACNLQEQIDTINTTLTTLNADYDVDCLTGVGAGDGTHAILQAVITKLCSVSTDLAALTLNVSTNYVAIADLNALIAAYLDSLPSSTAFYTKMVPYTVVEYYGSLSSFDATGAGFGDWINIYLCNGLNGTPDKRGRVPVGAIVGVPGGVLAPAVNPASSVFNPNYALGDTVYGVNNIVLDTTQIPSHTHSITDPSHFHYSAQDVALSGATVPVTAAFPMVRKWSVAGNTDYDLNSGNAAATVSPTSTSATGITGANATGGGLGHDNKQPSLATYYIMYIP